MNTKELIGKRIKELRKTKGLSQEQLSEKADVTPNYLSRIERGTENPTLDMLIKLAIALEIDMMEMFDFGHKKNRKELKTILNKFIKEANEEKLELAVKVLKAVMG